MSRNYDDVSEQNVGNKQVKGQMSLLKPKPDPSTETIKEIMGKMLLNMKHMPAMRGQCTEEFNIKIEL